MGQGRFILAFGPDLGGRGSCRASSFPPDYGLARQEPRPPARMKRPWLPAHFWWTSIEDRCILSLLWLLYRRPNGRREPSRDGHIGHRDPGGARAQPARRLAHLAPGPADLPDRGFRLGQELARF